MTHSIVRRQMIALVFCRLSWNWLWAKWILNGIPTCTFQCKEDHSLVLTRQQHHTFSAHREPDRQFPIVISANHRTVESECGFHHNRTHTNCAQSMHVKVGAGMHAMYVCLWIISNNNLYKIVGNRTTTIWVVLLASMSYTHSSKHTPPYTDLHLPKCTHK